MLVKGQSITQVYGYAHFSPILTHKSSTIKDEKQSWEWMISQAKVRMHIIHLKLKIILEWMITSLPKSHKTHIKLKILLEWMTFQDNKCCKGNNSQNSIPHGQRGQITSNFQQEGFSITSAIPQVCGHRHLKYRVRNRIKALLGFDGLAEGDHSLRTCPRIREES